MTKPTTTPDPHQGDIEVLDALERCVVVLNKISVHDITAFEKSGDVARCCLEILKKRGMEMNGMSGWTNRNSALGAACHAGFKVIDRRGV